MSDYAEAYGELQGWKAHTCVGCGQGYMYRFKRTGRATGEVGTHASQNLENYLYRVGLMVADRQPCPKCGLIQPDMIGAQQARFHEIVMGVTVVGLLAVLILHQFSIFSDGGILMALVGLGAAVIIAHLYILADNPNEDLQKNLAEAAKAVRTRKMRLCDTARPDARLGPQPGADRSPWNLAAIGGAALVLFFVPEAVRLLAGWPDNANCQPVVIGPGDSSRIFFPQAIYCLKAYWGGTADAIVVNPSALGRQEQFALPVTTRVADWGGRIEAGSMEKTLPEVPWCDLRLPNDPELAGKTIQVRLKLNLTYPAISDPGHFKEENRQLSQTVELHVAGTAGAGKWYLGLWLTSVVVGGGLLLAMGWLLRGRAHALKGAALPSKYLTYDEANLLATEGTGN